MSDRGQVITFVRHFAAVAFGFDTTSAIFDSGRACKNSRASRNSSASPVISRALRSRVRYAHAQSTITADQKHNVQKKPHKPGDQAREFPSAYIGNCFAAANSGHCAFVPIAKIRPWL